MTEHDKLLQRIANDFHCADLDAAQSILDQMQQDMQFNGVDLLTVYAHYKDMHEAARQNPNPLSKFSDRISAHDVISALNIETGLPQLTPKEVGQALAEASPQDMKSIGLMASMVSAYLRADDVKKHPDEPLYHVLMTESEWVDMLNATTKVQPDISNIVLSQMKTQGFDNEQKESSD